jgi:hypothetical protein
VKQLEAEAETGALTNKPPLTYDDYANFRSKFDRGTQFQGRAADRLKALWGKSAEGRPIDMSKRVSESEVGMVTPKTAAENKARVAAKAADPNAKGPGVPRADHVLVEPEAVLEAKNGKTIEVEVISDKSRDPSEYGFKDDPKKFEAQIEADAQEALDKYSGTVEIRSAKFGGALNGKTVRVKRVYVLYDASLLDAKARDAIRVKFADTDVGVIFSDQLGL